MSARGTRAPVPALVEAAVRAKILCMRFDAVRRLLQQLSAKEEAVLDSDETLTESEVALGRLVLPLFRDREALSHKLDELAQQAEALQVAVNHIPLPVLVLDPTGALLITNRAARDLFGGPAVPFLVLEEAKRFVLRPVHRERAADVPMPDGRKVRLRLILGQVRDAREPKGPQVVFAVPAGALLPLTPARLVERFGFTPKEAELTGLVAQGLTNKEIAAQLSVGAETVRSHLAEAFAKSGAKNRAELVTLAVAAIFGVGPEESP